MENFLIIIFANILLYPNLFAQNNKYIYERNKGESSKGFAERVCKSFEAEEMYHGVIEGFWGDESKGKKIIAFCSKEFLGFHKNITLVVLQPVGDGKNYILSIYPGFGGEGAYGSNILSVFFLDANEDGIKEIFIIEKGEIRIANTIEEEDENGNIVKYSTSSCCEDVYSVSILEHVRDKYYGFMPIIKTFSNPGNWNFEDLKTADEVKKRLKSYKKK